MKVLIACEESQVVCKAFRERGHFAFSCDISPCYGGHPEWHILGDCMSIIHGNTSFKTMSGDYCNIVNWDLIIAHPPCTYLCNCQAPLYNEQRFGREKVAARRAKQEEAIEFFLAFTKVKAPCAIENPIGLMSRIYRKADQTIQPWQFGHAASKATCLWLNGLAKLTPTCIVGLPKRHQFPRSNPMGDFFYKTSCLPRAERARARSKTFEGIARAMAEQWG